MKVLDQGYCELIEHWGSDERIIESARMSTAKGFLGWGPRVTGQPCYPNGDVAPRPREPLPELLAELWYRNGRPQVIGHGGAYGVYVDLREEPGDEKLLKFLWDNAHATPFEMAGLTIEVKAPIMCLREWHRHRVPFGYNEMSARYVPLPDDNYLPTPERVLLANAAGSNKQAQGTFQGKVVTEADALEGLAILGDAYAHAQAAYAKLLELGWPKELARLPVPVGRYSCMRATANLRGWLGFLKLRTALGAQYEIRQYAWVVSSFIRQVFPRTHAVAHQEWGDADHG